MHIGRRVELSTKGHRSSRPTEGPPEVRLAFGMVKLLTKYRIDNMHAIFYARKHVNPSCMRNSELT